MCERHVNLYEDLIISLKHVTMATAKLSKSHLTLETFTPTELKRITDSVLHLVQRAKPTYALALSHITQCDMKFVTFEVDNNYSLIVAIPVLIKAFIKKV